MTEEKKYQSVAKVAADLDVRAQLLYRLINQGDLISHSKEGRSKVVDPEEAARAVEEVAANRAGGRRVNWDALTDYLKASTEEEVRLEVYKLREMTKAPHAKLEMLHYWNPYRAERGQGDGLRAIRAAGFEMSSIEFAHSEFIGYVGVSIIVARRDGDS